MSAILVVTGGSRGIGAATVKLAATRGYDGAINYRSRQAVAEAVAAAAIAHGVRAITVRGGVTKEADVVRLFETVDRDLGRPSALVNNAGIVGPVGRVEAAEASALRPESAGRGSGCTRSRDRPCLDVGGSSPPS